MIKGKGEVIEKKYGVPRFFTLYNQGEFEALIKKAGFETLESFINKGSGETWITVFARVNK